MGAQSTSVCVCVCVLVVVMTKEGFLEEMMSGLNVKKQVGLTQDTGGRMLVQNSPDRGAAGVEAMRQWNKVPACAVMRVG